MNDVIVSLQNVSKIYRKGINEIRAVDSATLEIKGSELVIISGPSGSGKSTLLYLMAGLMKPTEGKITVGGKDLGAISDDELAAFRKETMGFIFQSYNLIPSLTALENIMASRMFEADKRYEKAMNILEELGLTSRMDNLPSELSGGEQQRVAIARGLLNDPKVIFADEPTGNLDSMAGENIIGIFKDLNSQGRTIVIATHEPEMFGYDRAVRFDILDGRLSSSLKEKING